MAIKAENGLRSAILLIGMLFFLLITLIALVPNGKGSDPIFMTAAGSTSVLPIGGSDLTADATPAATSGLATVVPPVVSAGSVAVQGVGVARMQPIQTLPTQSYRGVVDQVVNRQPGGWGQIHIIINDGLAQFIEISLAPQWFLQFQGCTVAVGDLVEGESFNFDPANATYLYAKNLVVNGNRCRLRTNDGLAIWSDQIG